jgi:ATP-dependent exoDNAse (exonuclease V) alpha subunit
MLQKTAKEIIMSGKNVFLTGKAGTGKTYLTKEVVQALRDKNNKHVTIVAPTGIAALNANGATIHSQFKLGHLDFRQGVKAEVEKYINKHKRNRYLKLELFKIEVLVMDEISMIPNPMFSFIDYIMRWAKNSQSPFGGVQLIAVGDFAQLEPITHFLKPFAWQSPSWREAGFRTCYLHEVYRQSEDDFLVDILNDIRRGQITANTEKLLDRLLDKEPSPLATKLYTTNRDVDMVNQEELMALKTEKHVHLAIEEGTKWDLENFYKNSLVVPELTLKVGALVMFNKNNTKKGYVNGTMGIVVDYMGKYPVVKIKNQDTVIAMPETFEVIKNDKVICSVTQVPLKLAWAITTHKSQGLTIDDLEIDLGSVFAYGMAYVALSRASSSEGLRILNYNPSMKLTHPLTLQIEERMQEASKRAEKEAEDEQ